MLWSGWQQLLGNWNTALLEFHRQKVLGATIFSTKRHNSEISRSNVHGYTATDFWEDFGWIHWWQLSHLPAGLCELSFWTCQGSPEVRDRDVAEAKFTPILQKDYYKASKHNTPLYFCKLVASLYTVVAAWAALDSAVHHWGGWDFKHLGICLSSHAGGGGQRNSKEFKILRSWNDRSFSTYLTECLLIHRLMTLRCWLLEDSLACLLDDVSAMHVCRFCWIVFLGWIRLLTFEDVSRKLQVDAKVNTALVEVSAKAGTGTAWISERHHIKQKRKHHLITLKTPGSLHRWQFFRTTEKWVNRLKPFRGMKRESSRWAVDQCLQQWRLNQLQGEMQGNINTTDTRIPSKQNKKLREHYPTEGGPCLAPFLTRPQAVPLAELVGGLESWSSWVWEEGHGRQEGDWGKLIYLTKLCHFADFAPPPLGQNGKASIIFRVSRRENIVELQSSSQRSFEASEKFDSYTLFWGSPKPPKSLAIGSGVAKTICWSCRTG